MAGDVLLTISALKPILDSSTTAFAVVASSEEIVLSNQAMADLVGESPQKAVGRNCFEFVAPEALPESRHRFHDVDDGVVLALTAPLEVLRPDGRITSMMASSRSITLAEGRFVLVEITPPGLYEERLAPSHTGAYLPILVTDHDWRVTYVTPFARELLSAPDDLIGSGLLGLVHPLDAGSLIAALAQLDDDGVAVSVQIRFRSGDAWRPVVLHVSTLCRHAPPRLVCLLWDHSGTADERQLVAESQAVTTIDTEAAIRHLTAQVGQAIRRESAGVELSDRQCEIIARSLRGQTAAEMARDMFLSRGTVRNALSNIYRRLGVSNQLELVALLTGGHPRAPEHRRDHVEQDDA